MRSARSLPPAWPCPGSVWAVGPARSPWPVSASPGTVGGQEGIPVAAGAPGRPSLHGGTEPSGAASAFRSRRTFLRAPLRRRLRAAVLALLVLVGGGLVVSAAWTPAKAALAQVLLERAWERTVEGEPQVRPWPWADTWPVARLTLTGDEPLVVLAGASGRTMAFGPGHLDGSARPGEVGNVVVAGHRDTHFRALEELRPGDPLVLEDGNGALHRYRVTATAVVHHTDTRPVQAGPDRLTLVTCWPFRALRPGGDLRYVVTAKRQ